MSQWTNPDGEAESARNVAYLKALDEFVKAGRDVIAARAVGSIGFILTSIDILQVAMDVIDSFKQKSGGPNLNYIPAKIQTVDLNTSETTESVTQFRLLPPHPNACQVCGQIHEPEQPHNKDQLYYQYSFFSEHQRWPTWQDALAHCTPEMQKAWHDALTEAGVWSEPKKET